ncbi:hypothetical protein BUALT_Bualt13G0084100 [Buddleja alternifolia]|uniref:Malectin-like domain-containing protein n=1 Tax=Buddleja alternifolia TaxID=168488 RepID=A0AAV6WMI1_9LAMI|nr:hypothetical protein BUALT_Bualt13G0084100 [Buddleja alternifolia]
MAPFDAADIAASSVTMCRCRRSPKIVAGDGPIWAIMELPNYIITGKLDSIEIRIRHYHDNLVSDQYGLFLMILWFLWYNRNQKEMENNNIPTNSLVLMNCSFHPAFHVSEEARGKPTGNGVGVMARDSVGKCLAWQRCFLARPSSAEEGECLASLEGLHLMALHGWSNVILEGAYLSHIQKIISPQEDLSFVVHLLANSYISVCSLPFVELAIVFLIELVELVCMAAHRISSLVFALCTLSVSAQASDSYKDENLIAWTGDDKYIQNGESHSVQTDNSISHVLDTLRVFTTRKKNCYYIDSIRRGRVLVRATFYYGNYDSKSSPPTFELQFDGNPWVTVETSSSDYVYYEVAYVMKNDSISVCVAQTNSGQFPFISAIEVRGLEMFMYGVTNANYPLFLRRRVAFGSNATIRYTDDPYDRIWTPEVPNNGLLRVSSDAFFSSVTILNDIPPPAVLKHAVTAISPNSSIQLPMGLPSFETLGYINWYFSEVTRLRPNQLRSFRIFKDNESFSEPILPLYENCTQTYVFGVNASSGTTFSLVPTNDSTLPHFRHSSMPWKSLNWFLGNFNLSGMLPDFSSMDALQIIDIHNNSLGGPIPDFLGTLPHLETL